MYITGHGCGIFYLFLIGLNWDFCRADIFLYILHNAEWFHLIENMNYLVYFEFVWIIWFILNLCELFGLFWICVNYLVYFEFVWIIWFILNLCELFGLFWICVNYLVYFEFVELGILINSCTANTGYCIGQCSLNKLWPRVSGHHMKNILSTL